VSDLEFDPFIASIARELKEPVRLDARFDERVMAALEPEVISIGSRRRDVPWYRRRVSVSAPMIGLAAAAAFGGIAAVGVLATRETAAPQIAQGGTPALVPATDRGEDASTEAQEIQFIYVAPQASSVALVGDFNDWQPTPMTRDDATGGWTVRVPLVAGRYQYQFVLDGTQHVADPTATMASGDFGSPNSVITVSPRQR
jgi:hypothetical protein